MSKEKIIKLKSVSKYIFYVALFAVSCFLVWHFINLINVFFNENAKENKKLITYNLIDKIVDYENSSENFLVYKYDFEKYLESSQENLSIVKIKIFDNLGKVIYSTDKSLIGGQNSNYYFFDVVRNRVIFSKIVEENALSAEGETVVQDVLEIYVPILNKDKLVGVIEVYYDISVWKQQITKLLIEVFLVVIISVLLFFILIYVSLDSYRKKILIEKEEKNKALLNEKVWIQTFNSIKDGILIYDKNFKIINYNQNYKKIIEFDTDLKNKSFESIKNNHLFYNKLYKETIKTKNEYFFEKFNSSSRKWLYICFIPVIDKNGEVEKVINYVREITSEKNNIKMMEKRNSELERFKKSIIGREQKMIELKKEISNLRNQLKNGK